PHVWPAALPCSISEVVRPSSYPSATPLRNARSVCHPRKRAGQFPARSTAPRHPYAGYGSARISSPDPRGSDRGPHGGVCHEETPHTRVRLLTGDAPALGRDRARATPFAQKLNRDNDRLSIRSTNPRADTPCPARSPPRPAQSLQTRTV